MHISYCRLPDKNEQRILPGFSSKNVRKSNYSRGSRDHVYCNIRCCSQKYSVSECERVKTSFCYILQFWEREMLWYMKGICFKFELAFLKTRKTSAPYWCQCQQKFTFFSKDETRQKRSNYIFRTCLHVITEAGESLRHPFLWLVLLFLARIFVIGWCISRNDHRCNKYAILVFADIQCNHQRKHSALVKPGRILESFIEIERQWINIDRVKKVFFVN